MRCVHVWAGRPVIKQTWLTRTHPSFPTHSKAHRTTATHAASSTAQSTMPNNNDLFVSHKAKHARGE